MAVQIFDSDDRVYQDWLIKHPKGFVANSVRSGQSKYFVVHRAACLKVAQYTHMARPGGYTERRYIKIASDSLPALTAWGCANRSLRSSLPRACTICSPLQGGRVSGRSKKTLFPDEVDPSRVGIEGAVTQITVNRYERDPAVRDACIKHFGASCAVCGVNFESVYGKLGRGYIHVHHLIPLSVRRKRYKVDPKKDLRPVCPNCHAMLHAQDPPLSPKALQKHMIKCRPDATFLDAV